jgi:hypothetical protein
MITQNKTQQIAVTVIKILIQRFETFPVDASNNRNAPFHKAFLNAFQDKFNGKVSDVPFFISLSSWLHGLNTTLGQTFFEKVAHILSDGEKREYTSKKLGNKQIHETQKNNVNEIMTKLSNSQDIPSLPGENELVFINDTSILVNALDFSADVFIEDDRSVTAIELKSVKPNSGEMRGEKQKILEGKAALYKMFPNKNIKFFMGFPFDPTSDTPSEFNKTRFLGSIINMTKFFDPDETLIAKELWDYLSGETNTMEKILEIINKISTPAFMEKFNFINDEKNKNDQRYLAILNEWFLFSEIELLKNDLQIKKSIQKNQRLQRIYNQQIFKKEDYNWERAMTLNELLQ